MTCNINVISRGRACKDVNVNLYIVDILSYYIYIYTYILSFICLKYKQKEERFMDIRLYEKFYTRMFTKQFEISKNAF